MNFKALGLAAALAAAAPLSAQAVTTLIPGGTFDIASDTEFVFEFAGPVSGVVDLHFTFTLTPPPNNRHVFAVQFTGTGASAANPQLNFAATNQTYVAGSGFSGPTISDGVVTAIATIGNSTSFLMSASTALNSVNGLTQVLNLGFLAGPGSTTQISLNVQSIPLPASALLLISAVAGLGFMSRRKAA
ncbi:MAG: VPLPA-CTERM sorting domain-containing protein [Pikeienuella sp.]|uniref:VPLPA-CTERM sorting domain-containing protein n=1 Tax=Pikeienuella sp. TaxID=2831957 RepID=UPI00391A954D